MFPSILLSRGLRSGPPDSGSFRGSKTDTIASQSTKVWIEAGFPSSLSMPSSLTDPPFRWSRRQRLQRVENVGREIRHHTIQATRIGLRFAMAIGQARATI